MTRKRKRYTSTDEEQIRFAYEVARSFSEVGLHALIDAAHANLIWRAIGFESVKDLVEQVHLEERERICQRTGTTYDPTGHRSNIICPNGFEHRVVSNGTTANGTPRYVCKDCGHAFLATETTLLAGRGFDCATWVQFISLSYSQMSLNSIAKALGISLETASEYRLLMFCALEVLKADMTLLGDIVADETYIPIDYKGQDNVVMHKVQREARDRGRKRNRSKGMQDMASVLCAIDSRGQSLAWVTGVGVPSYGDVLRAVGTTIPYEHNGAFVTDGSHALRAYADRQHLDHIRLVNTTNEQGEYRSGKQKRGGKVYSLQLINTLHSNLKKFIYGFSGVSTKYLQGYADMFCYAYLNSSVDNISTELALGIIKALLRPNHYIERDNLRGHFEDFVYNPEKGKRFKDYDIAEIEIYARYSRGETPEKICSIMHCDSTYVASAIRKLSLNSSVADKAISWLAQKEADEASNEEKLRQQEEDNRIDAEVKRLYREGHIVREIAEIMGIPFAKAQYVLVRARRNGEKPVRGVDKDISTNVPLVITDNMTQKEKAYIRDKQLQLEMPGSQEKERAEIIAKEMGLKPQSIVGYLNLTKKEHGEAIEPRGKMHSKAEWHEIFEDWAALRRNNMTAEGATQRICEKYGIREVTLQSKLSLNGYIAMFKDSSEEERQNLMVEEFETLCKVSFEKPMTRKEMYALIADKYGYTPRQVSDIIHRHYKRTGQPWPDYKDLMHGGSYFDRKANKEAVFELVKEYVKKEHVRGNDWHFCVETGALYGMPTTTIQNWVNLLRAKMEAGETL